MPTPKPANNNGRGLFVDLETAIQDLKPLVIEHTANRVDATKLPGSYLLLCSVPKAISANIRSLDLDCISPANYIYAGSAFGPGGLNARISRHFKSPKTLHWHIDYITNVSPPLKAFAFPHRTECELVSQILSRTGAIQPIKRFGSSDCLRCYAHLLQLPS